MSANNDNDSCTDIVVPSTIDSVTVFESSAQVHRVAQTPLPTGLCRLLFDELPTNVKADSLQVGLAGDGADTITLKGITFDNVTLTNETFEQETAEKQAAIAKLEELQKDLTVVDDELALNATLNDFTKGCFANVTSTDKDDSKDVSDVSMWTHILNATGESFEQKRKEQREIEGRRRAIVRLIDESNAVIGKRIDRTRKERKVAVLLSVSEQTLKTQVLLSYVIDGASWTAEYEVRVDSNTADVTLGYNAVVKQNTSEDWKGVVLSLSTARPSLSGRQPELEPWRIRVFKSATRSRSMSAKRFGSTSHVEPAVSKDTVTSVSFQIAGEHDVINSGDPCRVPIASIPLKTTINYVTVPKLGESAYAVAEVKNTSTYVLVAGVTNVFLDGQFVTSSTLQRVAPTADFKVNVGRDEGVSVEHKLISKKREESGSMLSGKSSNLVHKYNTKIRNGKALPITITVQQQIPLSNTDEVTVTLQAPRLKTKVQEENLERTGLVETFHTIAAGEEVEVPLHFSVDYPLKKNLSGI